MPTKLNLPVPGKHLLPTRNELDKANRTAFVFSGGASLGAFECGVAKYLIREENINPRVLCGASTGALNALKLAEGPQAIEGLEMLWRGLTGYRQIFTVKSWFLDGLKAKAGAQRELTDASAWNQTLKQLAFALRPYFSPATYFTRLLTLGSEISSAANGAQKDVSIFDTKPLRTLVEASIDLTQIHAQAHSQLTTKPVGGSFNLRLASVTLEDGELGYVTEAGTYVDSVEKNIGAIDLYSGVMASAAIPGVFPPVTIPGRTLVDGGTRENVPVKKAVDLGAGQVHAVLVTPWTMPTWEKSQVVLSEIAPRALDLMLHEVTINDVMIAQASGAHVNVYAPRIPLHNSLWFDPGLSAIAIDYGWMIAADVMAYATQTPNAEALAAADEIARLRYETWALEYGPGAEVGPENDGRITPTFSDADLLRDPTSDRTRPIIDLSQMATIRANKRKIKQLKQTRDRLGVKTPPGVEAAVAGWESHVFDSPTFGVWDALDLGPGNKVGRETPP